jgi:hypothetical protein
MNPMTIGIFVFAVTFGGALAGIWLHARLPEGHLSADSQATVKVGIALIATMTALVLGLVTASAKNSYDAQDSAVKHTAAEAMSLDRVLARYGPGAEPARVALHSVLAETIRRNWPHAGSRVVAATPSASPRTVVQLIRALPVQDDTQAWLRARALDIGEGLLDVRWAVASSVGPSVPVPFLIVLVFWLLVIFVSFGLFAPRNGTVISVLFVCAMSVASAIFLILEMDGPFSGVIRISPNPMLHALSQMTQ